MRGPEFLKVFHILLNSINGDVFQLSQKKRHIIMAERSQSLREPFVTCW